MPAKKHKVVALAPDAPQVAWAIPVALGYAGILVIMSLAQLFTLEEFIPIIQDYWLPGGTGVATLVACVVIFAQIFGLPFLLRMVISPLMRWVGIVCAAMVPLVWLGLAFYALAQGYVLENSGMLGEKIPIAAGWPQLALSMVLAGLAAAAIYGLQSRKH